MKIFLVFLFFLKSTLGFSFDSEHTLTVEEEKENIIINILKSPVKRALPALEVLFSNGLLALKTDADVNLDWLRIYPFIRDFLVSSLLKGRPGWKKIFKFFMEIGNEQNPLSEKNDFIFLKSKIKEDVWLNKGNIINGFLNRNAPKKSVAFINMLFEYDFPVIQEEKDLATQSHFYSCSLLTQTLDRMRNLRSYLSFSVYSYNEEKEVDRNYIDFLMSDKDFGKRSISTLIKFYSSEHRDLSSFNQIRLYNYFALLKQRDSILKNLHEKYLLEWSTDKTKIKRLHSFFRFLAREKSLRNEMIFMSGLDILLGTNQKIEKNIIALLIENNQTSALQIIFNLLESFDLRTLTINEENIFHQLGSHVNEKKDLFIYFMHGHIFDKKQITNLLKEKNKKGQTVLETIQDNDLTKIIKNFLILHDNNITIDK